MKLLLTCCFLLLTAGITSAKVTTLTGRYQGEDIYVQNTYGDDGVGFCAFEILVNGEVTTDEVNSSAFAIDLAQYNFTPGIEVEIEIRTKDNCGIKIINPQALSPRSTCTYTYSGLDMDGRTLTWKTTGEAGPLPFMMEQFRWNKWIMVGEVMGNGISEEQAYSFQVDPVHGENRFRIVQEDTRGKHYSDPITVVNETIPEVLITSTKIRKTVDFSGETSYELYSAFGRLISTGVTSSLSVSDLAKGEYFLNFGSTFGHPIRIR